MVDGSFFRAPKWVDVQKLPGTTKQVPPSWSTWLGAIVRARHVMYSPNLVWLAISVLIYTVAPYDIASAREWRVYWIAQRAFVNILSVGLYYGFWHITLYGLAWGQRKFKQDSYPSTGTMIHNIWYTLLGTLQATAWECIFLYLYATRRLDYIDDADILMSVGDAARFLAWTLFIPIWRSLHFCTCEGEGEKDGGAKTMRGLVCVCVCVCVCVYFSVRLISLSPPSYSLPVPSHTTHLLTIFYLKLLKTLRIASSTTGFYTRGCTLCTTATMILSLLPA